ncbi:Nuclease-related domain containing protein [Trypanosoma brucei equiperdum]|uniref:Nuclease-related domain containing protein n=1 Tax=Trypanosoma brucei equiperdum TaxID=630700 RepID=A0A3L6L0V6_9TRYP|nr:Nuclease-related domain containing protein [Trypanosoma brucei equiperdum]
MTHYVDSVLYWFPTLVLVVCMIVLIVTAVGLSLGKFWRGLSSWSWRRIFSLTRMSMRQTTFRASMNAEEAVETALRKAGWKHVFLRRRVFVPRLQHNREIDVVAVGPVVLVVEVKHWRGSVWCNGQRWFQQVHKTARALEFEDIREDNVVKAAALRRHIENDKRVPLPDFNLLSDCLQESEGDGTWYEDRRLHKQCGTVIIPVVVFTNPLVRLDPSTVKQKDDVFDLPGLERYAKNLLHNTRGASVFDYYKQRVDEFLRPIFIGRSITPDTYCLSFFTEEKVARVVERMRTWDMVYLLNGRLVHGDIVSFGLPSTNRHFVRQQISDVEITWFDGLIGFARTMWMNSGGMVKITLSSPRKRKVFSFPLMPRHLKSIYKNDRLVLKLAGTTNLEEIPLADIATLRLSQHRETDGS